MTDFHKSAIGVRFLEGTFPEFLEQVRRLNDNLEAQLRQNQAVCESFGVGSPDDPVPYMPVAYDSDGYARAPWAVRPDPPAAQEARCDGCGWTGKVSELQTDLQDTPDLGQRLDPGSVVPVGTCPKCDALCYIVRHPWLNNEIQFARLLCEIRANCDMQGFDQVLESMDLDEEQVGILWERAERVWEAGKEKYCGKPDS